MNQGQAGQEAATPSNLEAVDKLVRADRRIKVEEIAESLSISIRTVHSILHEDLGYSKVCCRWVPKMLSDANKAKRLEMSRKNLDRVQKEVFWDVRGPITVSFLEQGNTVNRENYCQLLQQVKKDIKNKRRGMQSRGIILHQDNARPHTATRTIETINQLGWELLDHPPYSPDLAHSDYHLFGALKSYTRGIHMETHDEVKLL
ncbi:histone-lysine N-methyltransferase SETMAR-like [Watersipora subatra]|uniref:histone-lysine N-methyltransferase SETMAR-like n=1 Tax=Watersipora subatra TaxID=2589382 RepID=UPI00355C4501